MLTILKKHLSCFLDCWGPIVVFLISLLYFYCTLVCTEDSVDSWIVPIPVFTHCILLVLDSKHPPLGFSFFCSSNGRCEHLPKLPFQVTILNYCLEKPSVLIIWTSSFCLLYWSYWQPVWLPGYMSRVALNLLVGF